MASKEYCVGVSSTNMPSMARESRYSPQNEYAAMSSSTEVRSLAHHVVATYPTVRTLSKEFKVSIAYAYSGFGNAPSPGPLWILTIAVKCTSGYVEALLLSESFQQRMEEGTMKIRTY